MTVVRTHDFNRTETLDRQYLPAFSASFDSFARLGTVELSKSLRRPTQLGVVSLREMSWREVTAVLGERPYLATFKLEPLNGTAILALSFETVVRMLDYRLGGGTQPAFAGHSDLTDTDFAVIGGVVTPMLSELAESLSRVKEVLAVPVSQESSVQFVQLAGPNEMYFVSTLQLCVGEDDPAEMIVALPFALARQITDAIRVGARAHDNAASLVDEQVVTQASLDVWLELPPVRLASTEVSELKLGDVIRFSHPLRQPLDLRAEVALGSEADVDAVGAEAFALRRELWKELRGVAPGWSEREAVIDLSLRARQLGLRCVVAAGCAVNADPPGEDAVSRERLAWHWAGRTALRPPLASRVSASSLMPSSTLIERVSTVMVVPAKPRVGGVNLIGDFDDSRVRSYATALKGAGMRLSRLQWAGGVPTAVEEDAPFAYSTTLLILDGDQLVDYVGEVSIDTLRNRRTIIAWDWPLARPLASAAAEAAMVGEVWAPSSFSERAIKLVAPRPVLRVSPLVVVPRDASRREAGLPGGFVFATVARLARSRPGDGVLANPSGAIEAFTSAFAPLAGPVLCVLLQGRKTGALAEACRSASGGRADVIVIETEDPVVADAASVTADCVVSLHRASAFGPDLARAMAVGRPVVATRYGGPMDFLSEDCAELIPYTITASAVAVHPFPAGAQWAEPDIEAAATALRSVYEDYEQARRKAWRGRAAVTRQSGPKPATRALRRLLGEPPFGAPEARDSARIGAVL